LESDFGCIFFKKNNYEYGLLISNFPEGDNRNPVGACGIKVFKSEIPQMVLQDTAVFSTSMYAEREDSEQIVDSLIGMLGSNNKIIST